MTDVRKNANWRKQAACLGTDRTVFFPSAGDHPAEAIEICRSCPVRDDCLEFAVTTDEVDGGIWGGQTWKQIKKARAARRRRHGEPDHGTRARYARGCRCDGCCTAKSEYDRAWRASRPQTI